MQEFKLYDVVPRLEANWRKDGLFSSSVGLTRNDQRSGAVVVWSKTFGIGSWMLWPRDGWARLVADATHAFFHVEDRDICGQCPPEFKDQLAAEGEVTDVLFKFWQESVLTS